MTITTSPRMNCMEIWGGNTARSESLQTVGIDLFIESRPFANQPGGGDIYYLTSCASGRITRMLLADVSGHGEAASGLAISLRNLMRRHVNSIDQQNFVEAMNREFGAVGESAFATAVVASYFHPTRKLSVALAGHPNPMVYRASTDRWELLEPTDDRGNRVSGLPWGIHEQGSYPSGSIHVEPGDTLLLLTDAFIELETKAGTRLGMSGLLEVLNELQQEQGTAAAPAEIASRLRRRLKQRCHDQVDDDATLIVARFTERGTRFRSDLAVPWRLVQGVRDRTKLVRNGSTEHSTS